MRVFYGLILVLFVAAVAVFAVQNHEAVTIHYLNQSTSLSLAANYSHLQSFNAALLANGNKNVLVRQQYASGAVFWDAAQAIRFGLEYAWLEQHFTEGPPSVDRRVQLSGWYVF